MDKRSVVRRLVAGAFGFGAACLVGVGPALADPPPAPPNCTAADVAQVTSQVAAATSAYLFAHPDVNAFFTSQKGKEPDELRDDLERYMTANPQVHAELQGLRQPLRDQRNRCQEPDEPE